MKKTDIRAWPLWAKIGLPAILLVIIALIVLFATGVIGPQSTPQTGDVIPDGQTSVPDVVGKSLEDAEKILTENDLIYIIKEKTESDMPEGTVISQDPGASNIIDKGSTVELIISEGKGSEFIVDVKGKPIEEAKVILEELGFVVKIEEKESKEVAPGAVISQSVDAGEEKEKGTEIILVGSIGSEEIDTSKVVKVPDLMGKSYEEATKALAKKNLYYSKEEVYNASLPVNTIIGMNPSAGEEVKAGTVIKLTVNAVSTSIVLKDYSHKTLESVKAALESQGLKVSVKYEESKTVSAGTIISQKPASGTQVEKGSTVVLTVSKGYTVTVPDVTNMKFDDAQKKLAECGLASQKIAHEPSDTVSAGRVISQSVAANTKVEQGTVVGLLISVGPIKTEPNEEESVPVTLSSLSIKSKPSKTTYYVGDSFNKSGLAVTAKYSDGTTKDVTKQVTVSSPDMSKNGTKTVTVSYEGKSANFTITVNSIKISLNKTSLSIKVGETGKLSATTTPSGCEVSWKSSNADVATVSNGTVTGKAPGNATITATIKRGAETKQATCSVSVTSGTVAVSGVTISEGSKSMKVGSSVNLTATVTPTNATNQKVTWSSSDTSVATVSSTGKVTAKAPGTAKITVKTDDGGHTGSCNVTVEKPEKAKLSSIAVTTKPSKTEYKVNDTLNTSGMVVTATYSDGSTAKVTGYKCSPEKLTSAGTQTIKVSYKEDSEEKTTSFTVTVKAEATSSKGKVTLTVTPDKTSVSRGDVITYTVSMSTKEKLASMAFLTVFPKDLEYVDNSGVINADAKSKLGFDAIDWTEWSSRKGAGKGENYVNGYASASKSGDTVICTFKAKVSDSASKGEYKVKLTGLDEFCNLDWVVFDESEIHVDVIPVKVS